MRRPMLKLSLVLSFLVLSVGVMAAQATAPAPPADAAPNSLQEPAPDEDVRAVRLSDVQGAVQIMSAGSVAFSQAQLNMPLMEGMKVVTAESGRAEIQFEDGSVARVTPNSSLTLAKLSRNEDGSTATVIEANSGLTYYELNGRAGEYAVQVGQDKIVPVDSSIFRLNMDHQQLDEGGIELAVMQGSVHVDDGENLSADVRTNQTMQFDPENADEYQLLQRVNAESWDQWNSDRDEALAQLDENATEARASTGNPDNPAWSDLDANGDWYEVPGYGEGWAPSDEGPDWDPYGEGAWAYYGDVGYTWVSSYSWGWWPYHCGAWNWFGGFGWMWFPGDCGWGGAGFGFYPYGVIWGIPPGYHCPRRPRPRPIHGPGRGPGKGPFKPEPLIAVNREPKAGQQFRSAGGGKTGPPRVLHLDGEAIAPVRATIHPMRGGPLGEGFTSSVERAEPGVMVRGAYGGNVYRPPTTRSPVYTPGRGYTPASPYPYRGYGPPSPHRGYAPPSRPAPAGGGRAAPPVFHAPAPAPAPEGRGHR